MRGSQRVVRYRQVGITIKNDISHPLPSSSSIHPPTYSIVDRQVAAAAVEWVMRAGASDVHWGFVLLQGISVCTWSGCPTDRNWCLLPSVRRSVGHTHSYMRWWCQVGSGIGRVRGGKGYRIVETSDGPSEFQFSRTRWWCFTSVIPGLGWRVGNLCKRQVHMSTVIIMYCEVCRWGKRVVCGRQINGTIALCGSCKGIPDCCCSRGKATSSLVIILIFGSLRWWLGVLSLNVAPVITLYLHIGHTWMTRLDIVSCFG